MKQFFRYLGILLWKAKYLIIIVLVLVAGFGGFYLYKQNRDSDIWKKAEDHYRRADYTKTATELKKVGMPSSAEKLKIYGQTMFAVKDYSASEKAYLKLYDLNKDVFAKIMVGNIANQQKKYDKAIKSYREVIKNNPNYIAAYSNLAIVYRSMGNNAEAIKVAEDGIKNNPGNTEMYMLLISLLAT
ncbi:MAG: tetratricopeptide repeat protein, partial [Candidatus Berkelbacteria bacterium]